MTSQKWEVPASAQNVSLLRREVVAFAGRQGIADAVVVDLRLALAEALSNAVLHAFAGSTPGCVSVEIDIDRDADLLRVHVRDDGAGVAPRHGSPGLGLGMPMMSAVADSVDVRARADGPGTEVALRFRALARIPVV